MKLYEKGDWIFLLFVFLFILSIPLELTLHPFTENPKIGAFIAFFYLFSTAFILIFKPDWIWRFEKIILSYRGLEGSIKRTKRWYLIKKVAGICILIPSSVLLILYITKILLP